MVEGAADQGACWCTQLPALMPIPSEQEASSAECYCQDCLRIMLAVIKLQQRTSNAGS
jgi:hypothetical protein